MPRNKRTLDTNIEDAFTEFVNRFNPVSAEVYIINHDNDNERVPLVFVYSGLLYEPKQTPLQTQRAIKQLFEPFVHVDESCPNGVTQSAVCVVELPIERNTP